MALGTPGPFFMRLLYDNEMVCLLLKNTKTQFFTGPVALQCRAIPYLLSRRFH